MATPEDKENVAPLTSSDPLQHKSGSPSVKRNTKKGRSKSIGPGGLNEPEEPKQDIKDAKNRRKSTYVPATKSIISADAEKAERQAARRRTLANRRVSFAPEATLHTWDVIEFMRDPTTSTDSSDNTRRASNITRSSNGGSPLKSVQNLDSDPPSTPPEQADEDEDEPNSPGNQRDLHQKKRRRSSGIPPMNFNNPDDAHTSDFTGSSDESGSDEEVDGSDDGTGTAMSLDVGDDNTQQSMGESESSTTSSGSSARLEAALRQAATTAGTRGIEYDEYGDASMELAGEEVTNAFKPWMAQEVANETLGSASLDQENVNPFSPAFKAKLASGFVTRPATVQEEDTGDLSMDVTRAVGGIMKPAAPEAVSSPLGDGTMDFTKAIGKIQSSAQAQSPQSKSGQKRRRSTAETGSPGISVPTSQSKRRRSSAARSSMGDDTMDLTMAVGGIQSSGSPSKIERRKSTPKRRSSAGMSDEATATMEFTQAVGGIRPAGRTDPTTNSLEENEELTMELTTVLGGIKAAAKAANEARPVTPQNAPSPSKSTVNTTPKDQERFKDAPDSGPKKLLTPMFQKQVMHSTEKKASSGKSRKSTSPAAKTRGGVAFADLPTNESEDENAVVSTTQNSSAGKRSSIIPEMPSLGDHKSPLKATPTQSPTRRRSSATPDSALKQQLESQLQGPPEPSPTAKKQQRNSPAKVPATPEKAEEPTLESRKLAESIKMMSTPRKETLKNATPRKQAAAKQQSPQAAPASRRGPTPKQSKSSVSSSPAKQLSEDLTRMRSNDKPIEKIQLQKFLDLAGIRFMDLTTTKRRMTTATTPSKARKAGDLQNVSDEPEVSLETAIVAAGCTLPELEMFEHSCHELKRYISDGKKVIKELEAETAAETPPLLQAYMAAGSNRKVAIDAQMREIKTHARYRSKEMWYAWRTQLLEDLMRALQAIGEGLIKDDEVLQHAENILIQTLPSLVEEHENLSIEAEKLEQEAAAANEEEKEELKAARERLQVVDDELAEKNRMLGELQRQLSEQDNAVNDLEESKAEFDAAIKEADRVKEACRGVSINEITSLKESVHNIEQTYGWSITSASSSPPSVMMTYKNQLKLFFHPASFQSPNGEAKSGSNSPISLSYASGTQDPTTTLRFFLQLLRASLHALLQCNTSVPDLLSLVSTGWDAALQVAEAERRLNLEVLTDSRIVSDERLCISSNILLPSLRTKVRVAFEVSASVGDGLEMGTIVDPTVNVVYGEKYNEDKMTEFLAKEIGGEFEGWDGAVRDLRERLVARGAKGMRK